MRSVVRWTVPRMAYYQEPLIEEARQMLAMGMLTELAEAPVNFVSCDDIASGDVAMPAGDPPRADADA